MFLRVGQNAIGQRLRIGCRQRRHIQRPQMSMDANAGRAIRGDMEVAASHFDHLFEQLAQGNPGHLSTFFLKLYRTVSRKTSSSVVCPRATFTKPLRRRVIMPCSIAFFFNSSADAPTRINSRSSSFTSITSYKPVRPLYPPLLQVVHPLPW